MRVLRNTAAIGVLLAVAGLLGWGAYRLYRESSPRTLDVCVVTDFGFRAQRPSWSYQLQLWTTEINRALQPAGLQLKTSVGGDAYSEYTDGDLTTRKAKMDAYASCKADVVLGLTAQGDRDGVVAVSPFSHSALMAALPNESDAMVVVKLVRTFARLFGVPTKTSAFVTTDLPDGGILDASSLQLIAALRRYDFVEGTAALPGRWEKRAVRAFTDAFTGRVANPSMEAHRSLGRAFADAGMHEQAIVQFQEAVRSAPSDPQIRLELALQLSQDARQQEAITELRQAMKLDSTDARPHAILGTIFLNGQQYENAIDEFHAAIALDPNQPYLHSLLARVLTTQLGAASKAADAFRTALRLDPHDQEASLALKVLESAGVSKTSELRALEAEARANESASTRFRLGLALVQAADVSGARREFQRALQLEPKNGGAHYALARLDYAEGDYAGAQREIAAAQDGGVTAPTTFVDAVKRKLAETR